MSDTVGDTVVPANAGTVAYPSTIPEAALILDTVKPDWAKSIHIEDLNIRSCRRCILGHLFGEYEAGMQKVFRIDVNDDVYGDAPNLYYYTDEVFGCEASLELWLDEIRSRL